MGPSSIVSASSASTNTVHRHASNGSHTDALYRSTAQNKTTISARKSDDKHSSLKTVKNKVTSPFDNGLSTVIGTLSAETRELDIDRVEKDVRLLKSEASQVKDRFDRVDNRFVPMEGEMCDIKGGCGGGGESQLESDRRARIQPVKNASTAYYFHLKV